MRGTDRVLVGVDAKGIQLRELAHYLNNPKFTEAVLSKDPHEANRVNFKLPSRPVAKTVVYSVLMGAGDALVASQINMTLKEAKEIKRIFFEQVPELPLLINTLKAQAERTGRITLCDGTPILVKHPHMVIPYLLQGDESRIMKKAAILADTDIRRRKLDVLKVGDIHDEHQYDTYKDHADELVQEVLPVSFRDAGVYFDYRLPI